MDFRTQYPQYAEIEEIIRRARAERSVALGEAIATFVTETGRLIRDVARGLSDGLALWRTQRGVEASVLEPKSLPHH